MQFSSSMIEMATAFKSGGVPWDPAAGHYVLDHESIVQRESPFQEGVYFILNLPHFFKLAGGRDAFVEKMVWLPTWAQAREILRESGLSDRSLQSILHESNAIAEANELTILYQLIAERFEQSDSADS